MSLRVFVKSAPKFENKLYSSRTVMAFITYLKAGPEIQSVGCSSASDSFSLLISTSPDSSAMTSASDDVL